MQCRTCGIQLPQGAAVCPNCGTPTPYNVSPNNAPRIEPTMPAYPPSNNAPRIEPTMPAYPSQPPQYPQTSYGGPPPPPAYAPPSQNSYGAVPPYASPAQSPYGAMPPYAAQPLPVSPPVPAKRSNRGLFVGIGLIVALLVIVGGAVLLLPLIQGNTAQKGPSGAAVDSSAAGIVNSIQTASSIDPQTTAPLDSTKTFKTNTIVYVTFKLDLNKFDFNKQTGYVQGKFYAGKNLFAQKILTVSGPAPGGAFEVQYYVPAAGGAEIYWCLKSDCSDAKLAQMTTFTVTS